jgi:hypothetical protein
MPLIDTKLGREPVYFKAKVLSLKLIHT